jgi:hypothetical protein
VYSALAEPLHECQIELFSPLWITRFEEARPPAPAGVGEQRELRHDQRRALGVFEAQVHLAGLITEDAHVDDLVGEPAHSGVVVI